MAQKVVTELKMKWQQETTSPGQIVTVTTKPRISDNEQWLCQSCPQYKSNCGQLSRFSRYPGHPGHPETCRARVTLHLQNAHTTLSQFCQSRVYLCTLCVLLHSLHFVRELLRFREVIRQFCSPLSQYTVLKWESANIKVLRQTRHHTRLTAKKKEARDQERKKESRPKKTQRAQRAW